MTLIFSAGCRRRANGKPFKKAPAPDFRVENALYSEWSLGYDGKNYDFASKKGAQLKHHFFTFDFTRTTMSSQYRFPEIVLI